jgi:flavin reductase (DIM6/NTAB) family NADH-FMN oxidoreductase RutF
MGGVFASAPLKPPAKSPHHGRRRKLEKLRTRQASKTARAARVTHMQPISQPASTSSADDPAIASALGRIPSGLFVVAWRDSNADRSMLASWVMQAGFAPPLVSVAVAAARDLLAAIDREVTFVVSVLADSQRPLLARFGKPSTDPFAGLAVHRTPSGTAALADAAAWLECRAVARATHGDHVIVLGEVLSAGGAGSEPLTHVRKNGLRY